MSFSDLPLPSKIVCLCNDKEIKCEKHTPDRRLLNWEKWTEERKRTNKALARALDRHSEQLLINYGEDIRTIKEEKAVIENTNIIYPHDHYRGNPSFWRVPIALRKQPHQPDYFSVMTSAQKCEIPSMEYIKVPNVIRHEKDAVTTGYRNEKQIWDRSEYRKHKIEELKNQIEIVEPFKPDLDNLFIKGVGIATTHVEYLERVTPETTPHVSTPGHVVLPINIHADEDYLMMDNLKLCNHIDNDVHVYLSFEYDIGSKQVLTKTIKLTNGTSYALRYCFVAKKKFHLFRDIVEDKEEQVFFYNKRELILLPKDSFKFPIGIKTDLAFTHRLQLVLQTRPNLWKHTFVINLAGIATYKGLSDKCANIKQRIETETCKVIARDLVQDMLVDVHLKDEKNQLTTFYVYDKPTIFEVVNQKYTPVTRHPKYIYNKDIVEELENFYLKIRLPDAPASWDLNIEHLREMTKKRQELNYRKTFIEELLNIKNGKNEKKDANVKSTTAVKAKNSFASKSTLTQSIVKSKSVISRSEEHKTFGNNLIEELEEILMKLQQFTMWFNENRTLYESCYTVLCTAFDTILEEVYRIEADLNIRKIDRYPEQFKYNPHVFEGRVEETHYDLPGQAPRITEDFIADAKPATECLKDIPLEESKARYDIYYGNTDNGADSKNKGKGKKGPKEKPKKKDANDKKGKGAEKKAKSQEKSVSRTESADVDLKENPFFNIDAEPTIPEDSSKVSLKQSLSSEDDSSDVTSGLLLKEYKRSLYEVFYRNILEAAVKLVDIIELHKHEEVRVENIKRMVEEASVKQPPVQMRVVDLREAIRVAMDLPKKYKSLYSYLPEKCDQTETQLDESVQKKEEGSEWSILRPLKGPEPTTKPISHPDTNVYLKKKNSRRLFKDVGTIMSNAGIDPNWQDFKEVGVQITTKRESRPEKEEFMSTIISDVVDEVCRDVEDGVVEEESETKSSEVLFCCDEIPVIPNKSTQNINYNEKKC